VKIGRALGNLLAALTIYLAILAGCSNSAGGGSSDSSTTGLAAVTDLIPARGTTIYDRTPALGWAALEGAASYEVQLATTEAGLSSVSTQAATTNTLLLSSNMDVGTTYYWRVRGLPSMGDAGAWSEADSFTISWGAIGGRNLADASVLFNTKPILSWAAIDGAASYDVQVATSADGLSSSEPVPVTAATYTCVSLANGSTYYWRVRSVKASGADGWCSTRSFSVATGKIDANGMSPQTNATTNDTTPALSWGAVSGAAKYQLQIGTSYTGLSSVTPTDVSGTSYTPASPYSNATAYYWDVRAVDYAGDFGPWSAVNTLTIQWDASTNGPADGFCFPAELVELGSNSKYWTGGSYFLGTDIDVSGVTLTAIGSSASAPFVGTFDGKGHKISNLAITLPKYTGGDGYYGFFGYIGHEGIVKNLTLSGASTPSSSTSNGVSNVGMGYDQFLWTE
jgi:hypothetical protein